MNDGDFYYSDFISKGCKIKGTKNGYVVVATQRFKMGQVIEECATKKISSTLEEMYESKNADEKLLDGLVTSYDMTTKKTSLYLVGGNFTLYGSYPENNAVYQHDHRFGIVTVRAIKDIEVGEEILFYPIVPEDKPMKPDKEKKGCGCGKKRSSGVTPTSLPKQSSGPPKILNKKPVKVSENQIKRSSKFKSMSGSGELKSIKVDK